MKKKLEKIVDEIDTRDDGDQGNIFEVDENTYDATLELDENGRDNLIGVAQIFKDYFDSACFDLDIPIEQYLDFTVTYTTTFNDLDQKLYYEGVPVLEFSFISEEMTVPFQYILPKPLNDYETLDGLRKDLKPFLEKTTEIISKVLTILDYYEENNEGSAENYPEISEFS